MASRPVFFSTSAYFVGMQLVCTWCAFDFVRLLYLGGLQVLWDLPFLILSIGCLWCTMLDRSWCAFYFVPLSFDGWQALWVFLMLWYIPMLWTSNWLPFGALGWIAVGVLSVLYPRCTLLASWCAFGAGDWIGLQLVCSLFCSSCPHMWVR